MFWLSNLFPQTILQTSSPYNREIRVNLESGRYKLLVNGSRQSGTYIEKLWKHAFSEFRLPQSHLQGVSLQILVLGVGGGTVIHLIRSYYPKASIIGVEIDQTMIDIGRTYFNLGTMKELQIICDDAQSYVPKAKKSSYDLVIVDLFSGRVIPDFEDSREFLMNIKQLLRPNGILMMNYLRELEYREKSEKLYRALQTIFSLVNDYPIALNRFFIAFR